MKETPKSRVTVMLGREPHAKETVFYQGEMILPRIQPMEARSKSFAAQEVRRQLEIMGTTGINWDNTRVYINGVVLPRTAMGQCKLAAHH